MSQSQYEEESEFSYVHSDIQRPQLEQLSSANSEEDEGIGEFQPPNKLNRDSNYTTGRESYMSSMSEYSETNHNIAQPVSVKVVNEPVVPTVNRSMSQKQLKSQIGSKLETQKGDSTTIQPDISYSTNVEGSIPRRSSKRPKSDIEKKDSAEETSTIKSSPGLPDPQFDSPSTISTKVTRTTEEIGKQMGHRKRISLAISDDLDKLMRSANSIKSKSYTFRDLPSDDSSTQSKEGSDDLHGSLSGEQKQKESFGLPIDSLASQALGTQPLATQTLPKVKELPPRPSVENLARAREVSSKIEGSNTSINRISQSLPKPPIDDVESAYSDDPIPKSSNITMGSGGSGSGISGGYVPVPYTPPPEEPLTQEGESKHLSSQVYDDEQSSNFNEPGYPNKFPEDSVEGLSPVAPEVPPKPEFEKGHLHHDSIQAPQIPHQEVNPDEQFYDIEEPEIVNKPGRAKSVKDSTKHPKRTKSKKEKRVSSKNQLKPFSYHTLINLLESINGTIIGEEFNQLNLPVKEKQLIEKIVDQLSRLTSDMVLDEQRYEIGIDRLERALRVLEGFM